MSEKFSSLVMLQYSHYMSKPAVKGHCCFDWSISVVACILDPSQFCLAFSMILQNTHAIRVHGQQLTHEVAGWNVIIPSSFMSGISQMDVISLNLLFEYWCMNTKLNHFVFVFFVVRHRYLTLFSQILRIGNHQICLKAPKSLFARTLMWWQVSTGHCSGNCEDCIVWAINQCYHVGLHQPFSPVLQLYQGGLCPSG